MAVFPRLLALGAVVGCAIILLVRREWLWLERLRWALGIEIAIAAVSLYIDSRYFPRSVLGNGIQLGMMCVWFLYLAFSDRVHRVFRTKDWTETYTKSKFAQG